MVVMKVGGAIEPNHPVRNRVRVRCQKYATNRQFLHKTLKKQNLNMLSSLFEFYLESQKL
ncbi:MAG: hypothetical protein MUE44_09375 [Oscillatoriaceae cyanobacterium Prado104]|nr:hypothetical protein [Oscillatoriaceae cyanobacterium Prado104]